MPEALDILRSRFGYDNFRFQQQRIIDTLLAGGDALVLMPTGGGKSLCYQVPSILRDGVGIVVHQDGPEAGTALRQPPGRFRKRHRRGLPQFDPGRRAAAGRAPAVARR